MRFAELSAERRPNSEASGNTRSDAGKHISRDLISSVIERWRSASMSHKGSADEDFDIATPVEGPALQPAPAPAPPPTPPQPSGLRSSLLKKPLEGSSPYPIPNNPPRFR